MLVLRKFIHGTLLVASVLLMLAGYPLSAAADTSGITQPTGAAAWTYAYNETSGLWENDYYTWNPDTKETLPKFAQTYTYNPATGQYDTTTYMYNAAGGKYDAITLSVTQPPAGSAVMGGPVEEPPVPESTSTNLTDGSDTQNKLANPSAGSGSLGSYDVSGNVTVNNKLISSANSGDAIVLGNTTAGNATSGGALSMATILNILQSSTSLQGGNITTFTKDIDDMQNDLILDASLFSSLASITTNPQPDNLTINTSADSQINNDITLNAGSGNAIVGYNTTAGSASTGDSAAIANIVNVINSVIGANQTFVGTINIKGNLDGDILLPPDTINTLLATGSNPTLTTTGSNDKTLTANITDNSSITNNLDLAAKSGNATVDGNTTGGDATTGSASTNITLLNLTGKQIIGNDALLVFVNVMGKWVGMIVNAPSGSTSAALGGGISDNSSLADNTAINSETNSSINNNVKLNATSGNAFVTKNTTGGNATTGNAKAGVNLLNISSSSLSLSNWLGILFINVFGSWNGSFGVDTLAGGQAGAQGGSGGGRSIAEAVKSVQVFSLAPSTDSSGAVSYGVTPLASALSPTGGSASDDNNQPSTVLATVTGKKPPITPDNQNTSYLWTSGGLLLLGAILSTEEIISKRREARAKFRGYIDSITVQPFKRD